MLHVACCLFARCTLHGVWRTVHVHMGHVVQDVAVLDESHERITFGEFAAAAMEHSVLERRELIQEASPTLWVLCGYSTGTITGLEG